MNRPPVAAAVDTAIAHAITDEIDLMIKISAAGVSVRGTSARDGFVWALRASSVERLAAAIEVVRDSIRAKREVERGHRRSMLRAKGEEAFAGPDRLKK